MNRVVTVKVELDSLLLRALVRIPAGHAHRAVRKSHLLPALDQAAAIVVLGLGHERITVAVARSAGPERTNEADEALVAVGLPAFCRGIEGRRLAGSGGGRLVHIRHHRNSLGRNSLEMNSLASTPKIR